MGGGDGSGDDESSDDGSEGKYPGIASGPNGDAKSARSLLLPPRSGQTDGGGVGAWGLLSSFRREDDPLYGVSFFGCAPVGASSGSTCLKIGAMRCERRATIALSLFSLFSLAAGDCGAFLGM